MEVDHNVLNAVFAVFSVAAVAATICLALRQPLIVAYIVTGIIIGPHGLGVLSDSTNVAQMGQAGIIFLLFLIGMELAPSRLMETLTTAARTTLISSVFFAASGMFIAYYLFSLTLMESAVLGMCVAFSSTVIGIKLLPASTLHHQTIGSWVVSALLVQDILAVLALVALSSLQDGDRLSEALDRLLAIPGLAVLCYGAVRYMLVPLFVRFDRFQEHMFLLTLGWCLGFAWLAGWIGLTHEIGAFIAGVGLASLPVAQYISVQLRPLRDFFLIVFFVSVGASIKIQYISQLWLHVLLIGCLFTVGKSLVFYLLFAQQEARDLRSEIAGRLAQMSEFSLLIAAMAAQKALISASTCAMIMLATITSMMLSTYWVVFRYPTPIALNDRLRRD